jgi:hypothetical protein
VQSAFEFGKPNLLLSLFFASCSIIATLTAYALIAATILYLPFALPAFPPILVSIGSIFTAVELSMLASLAVTIPGTLLDTFLVEPFKAWWNKPAPASAQTVQKNSSTVLFTKLAVQKEVQKELAQLDSSDEKDIPVPRKSFEESTTYTDDENEKLFDFKPKTLRK